MTEILIQMMIVPLLFVVIALCAIGYLAFRRYSLEDWRKMAKNATQMVRENTAEQQEMETRVSSLDEMLKIGARNGSAYADPTRFPGYDHLERVVEKVQASTTGARRS